MKRYFLITSSQKPCSESKIKPITGYRIEVTSKHKCPYGDKCTRKRGRVKPYDKPNTVRYGYKREKEHYHIALGAGWSLN